MSFDVHHLCPDRSTCLITLQDVESNPEPATDPARRAKLPSCRALGYQRSQLAPPGTARLPEGWREVTVTSTLGTGVDLFGAVSDDLLELAAHVRAGPLPRGLSCFLCRLGGGVMPLSLPGDQARRISCHGSEGTQR